MQKYKSNITSTTGAAIRNVPVTVLNEAGELASLFLDRAGAIAAPNPLVTDSSGNFYFYAVNGRYSLRTTVEGVTITDDDVVLLQDPVEITVAGPIAEAVASAQAAARQAQEVVDSSGIPEMVAAAQNAVIDSNQALQEARGASLASAEAKQAAESAKSAAELAKGDAQAASSTANTAAQQANAAAQNAAQSAASIDPARLLTPAERQKLDTVQAGATKVESTRIAATSLQDFFAQCLAKGSGFYRADGDTIPIEMRFSPGWFSKTQDTWSFSALRWDTAKPVFYAGRFEDIPTSTWKQFVLTATAQTWTVLQTFSAGANISRIGINTPITQNVGVYCLDTTFNANATIAGVNMDVSTDTTTLTATRTHRGGYLRIRGNNTATQLAGFTNNLTGVEGVVEVATAADGVGEASYIYGVRGYATDNAARTQALNGCYAGWFNSQHIGTTAKSTIESIGVLAQVTNNNTNSKLNRATGVHTAMVNTAGTIITAYIYRGTYTGSGTYGVKWGIHLAGSTQNQIDGWLALTDTTPATSKTTGALRVAGGVGVGGMIHAGGLNIPTLPLTAYSDDAATTAFVQALSLSGTNGAFNALINPNMEVSWRGTNFSIPAAASYAETHTLDRWRVTKISTAVATVSQFQGSATYRTVQCMRYVVNTAMAALATGSYEMLEQPIEGFNIADLIGRDVTFSALVYASKVGKYTVRLHNPAGNQYYLQEIEITAANKNQLVTFTIPGGLNGAVSWNIAPNQIGLRVGVVLAAGSAVRTENIGAWTNGSFIAGSNQVNLLDTVGAEFRMTDVQLYQGARYIPVNRRPLHQELDLCARYLPVFIGGSPGANGLLIGMGQAVNTATVIVPVKMRVPCRVVGTGLILQGALGTYACANTMGGPIACTAMTYDGASSPDVAIFGVSHAGGFVTGAASYFFAKNNILISGCEL